MNIELKDKEIIGIRISGSNKGENSFGIIPILLSLLCNDGSWSSKKKSCGFWVLSLLLVALVWPMKRLREKVNDENRNTLRLFVYSKKSCKLLLSTCKTVS